MKKFSRFMFGISFVFTVLSAEDLKIEDILNALPIKDDLSNKTKIENGGISYIYTREDLRKMQAHTLKDILKSTYPFGYSENRFGLPDPNYNGGFLPFSSSNIRIYIDDQEITNGLYGSGIIIYGDMDIDFVDHVEVYSGNPTFEFSSESAFTIIKLYSKIAQKDEGSKINMGLGSRGSTYLYGYNTKELENGWSYFTYLSSINNNRTKYHHDTSELSRDKNTVHIFTSIYNDDNKILLDGMVQNRDIFIANSIFGTPKNSSADIDYFHMGYNGKKGGLSYLVTFDEYDGKSTFVDENSDIIKILDSKYNLTIPYDAFLDFVSQSYTVGVKYNIKTIKNNFLVGLKYRYKHFTFDDTIINDEKKPDNKHDEQKIATAFFENQFTIDNNKIFTLGATLVDIQNNNSNQNDDLFSYRTGYTYTNKNIVSKTVFSHIETTLDPYLVNNSMYLAYPDKKISTTKHDIFMENLKYKKGDNLFEFIASYILLDDKLLYNSEGKLDTYTETIEMKSILTRYVKEYNTLDKLEITMGYNHIDNLPRIDRLDQYAITLRHFYTYQKFDFFNEFLFYRDDMEKKNYCDYTMGITYRKSEDLSFTLKGTNLFDRAREAKYGVLSPEDITQQTLLSISPIDRNIVFTVEYTF